MSLEHEFINIPLYPGKLCLFLNIDSREELLKFFPDYPDWCLHAESNNYTWDDTVRFSIVFSPGKFDISGGDIAHECLHIVNYIWTHIGADHDTRNDEPSCYLLGWVYDQVYKFLTNHKIDIK